MRSRGGFDLDGATRDGAEEMAIRVTSEDPPLIAEVGVDHRRHNDLGSPQAPQTGRADHRDDSIPAGPRPLLPGPPPLR